MNGIPPRLSANSVPALHHRSATTVPSRTYSTVKGIFLQDDDSTDPSTFDPVSPCAQSPSRSNLSYLMVPTNAFQITSNFGLKSSSWPAFTQMVSTLNSQAPPGTSYKTIFFARHGEGWHNVARAYYGDIEWVTYWGERKGNGTVTWFDAHLTPNGIQQAAKLGAAWQHQISNEGTPAPQSYYTSPLDRTCETANVTFSALRLPEGAIPFVPTIKENLREELGVFTENERSNKTWIASTFPTYKFEDGFTEDDELWSPLLLELPNQLDSRVKGLLDDVWNSDENRFLSFTSHSLAIAGLLRVIGHRTFDLGTGGMIPVLIQATVDE